MGVTLVWLVAIRAAVRSYDGGILASSATFVLHGQVPYRDFWLLYGPLGGYLLALPTAVLGPSIELLRGAGLGVAIATAYLSWVLLDRVELGPASVLLAVAAGSVTILITGTEVGAWPLAIAFVLAGFAVMRPDATRQRLVVAGALLGLAFLARLDVGGYGLLALLLAYPRRWAIAGFAVVAVPATILAVALVPVANLVEQLIWFPLVGTREFRGIADPAIGYRGPAAFMSLVLVWLPRIGIAIALLAALRAPRHGRLILMLASFAALCQLQTLGRADYFHFAQAASPAILAMGAAAGQIHRPLTRFTLVAAIGVLPLMAGTLNVAASADPQAVYAVELEQTAAEIRALTCQDEGIFVGDGLNRYTFVNPLVIYYWADRPAASLYTMFNPGVTNREDAQQRIVAELERADTRVIVLDMSMSDAFETSNDSRVPGSTSLDSYIESAFGRHQDIGALRIMLRLGATWSCPEGKPPR